MKKENVFYQLILLYKHSFNNNISNIYLSRGSFLLFFDLRCEKVISLGSISRKTNILIWLKSNIKPPFLICHYYIHKVLKSHLEELKWQTFTPYNHKTQGRVYIYMYVCAVMYGQWAGLGVLITERRNNTSRGKC